MADRTEAVANNVISQLLSVPLIRANQDGDRPEFPYATYKISSRSTVGRDEHGSVDDSGIMPIYGVREGTLMINVFGGNAREICDDLINAIRKVNSRYLMRHSRFVISNNAQVNDLSTTRDNVHFEPMANVDLTFRYTFSYNDDVGVIEQVDATGTVGNEGVHTLIPVIPNP